MYESLEIGTNAKFFLFEKNAEKKLKRKINQFKLFQISVIRLFTHYWNGAKPNYSLPLCGSTYTDFFSIKIQYIFQILFSLQLNAFT